MEPRTEHDADATQPIATRPDVREHDAASVPTWDPADARRSDRWSSASDPGSGNWWVVVGALLVVAGYAVAFLVVSAARGPLKLSDDAGTALVAAAPGLAALGTVFGFVGARRSSVRALGWMVFGVGLVLVLATIAAIAYLLLVLRSFE